MVWGGGRRPPLRNGAKKTFFLHIRFGLRVYIVVAKNGIFTIFSALATSKNVIISDIFGQTLGLASGKISALSVPYLGSSPLDAK